MKDHYCRVYIKGRRPIILRIARESGGRFLRGIEVNKSGEEIKPAGADERLHLIEYSAIDRRHCLTFHPKYGVLVGALNQKGHGA